jgi:nucleotide-binding universal stress UspA family protein
MADGGRPVVVVGVDGSAGADAALRYAVAEAHRRGGHVLAVTACDSPDLALVDFEAYRTDPEKVRASAEERARQHVDEVLAAAGGDREVDVEVRARLGGAVGVLTGAGEGAALLVVGHRGRGAFRSTAFGSVGTGCVLHAPCAVTVVPAPTP